MSLPIHILRKKLQELIQLSKRGYMATLSALSGVPDGTINRIAFGKQTTVTYKVWKKLHEADPELPAPPLIQQPKSVIETAPNPEKEWFVTALQHFFPMDAKFKSPEDLALSVGMTAKAIKSLLKGDYRIMPNIQEQKEVASAFGLRIEEFLAAGKRLSEDNEGLQQLKIFANMYDIESVTTSHPDLVQIVIMAEKLNHDKIRIIKELTIKLLIAQIKNEKESINK